MNQRVAVTLLQKWGHTTVLACNGLEAVEKSTEEDFDLILMDVSTSINCLLICSRLFLSFLWS